MFSNIVLPLTQLTRKDTPFVWGPKHQDAFEALKATFSKAPVLIHFDPNSPIIVKMDASDYAIATIISQITPSDGDIHLIAFYSCGLALSEMNYEIYDKELLTIFRAFKQWWNYLKGVVCQGTAGSSLYFFLLFPFLLFPCLFSFSISPYIAVFISFPVAG